MTLERAVQVLNEHRHRDHQDWIAVRSSGEPAAVHRNYGCGYAESDAVAVAKKLLRDAERLAADKVPLVARP